VDTFRGQKVNGQGHRAVNAASPTRDVASNVKGQGHVMRLTGVGQYVEYETSQKHQNLLEGRPPHGQ